MKKTIITLLILPSLLGYTQAQLENGNFEAGWDDVSGSEDEPKEWSSLKSADDLTVLAPIVMFQTTDAHSGAFAIRLKNTSTFGVVANGIMTNGRVHADLEPENGYVYTVEEEADWNTPFTDRPDSLVAWFKYNPVGGDKGKIEILLHQNTSEGILPETGSTAHWVGAARYNMSGTTSTWTRLSVPFNYLSSSNPDYALVVISTGDSTLAVSGSELFIDDITLIYNPTAAAQVKYDLQSATFSPSPSGYQLSLKTIPETQVILNVYGLDGRLIYHSLIHQKLSDHLINYNGLLIYTLEQDGIVSSGKLISHK